MAYATNYGEGMLRELYEKIVQENRDLRDQLEAQKAINVSLIQENQKLEQELHTERDNQTASR